MARAVSFPSVKPSGRSYSPGTYPQTQFEAQNGAVTVVRFGSRRVNAELGLSFDNITDREAADILANFETVNRAWDYVTFNNNNGSVASGSLASYIQESGGSGLRWRYAEAPSVSSVMPGVVKVQCRFVGVLDPS